ncbi:hypothetical protein DNI29_20235 [Hymenobacter sediminis]|uniref:universal stress protein n=1 Tax=Hymenobacter sediminis TaxID=2218621 RepID=UPI000DA68DDF|nr:universal stress protein [Hymenobacter sediminis]RPD45019.1 hypothetical protein DNI29_20235 [Hymenobacter sediminis]
MLTFHVLTDFSATAANAMQYAVAVARHVGGQVWLWHILPDEDTPEGSCFHTGPDEIDVSIRHRKLAALATQVPLEVPCSYEVIAFRNPIERLNEALGLGTGHVVVVGNGNPAKLLTPATRSTALHLVRQLTQPLLVVPNTFRAGPVPRRIVLDTDRRAVRLPAAAATIPGLLAQLTHSRYPLTLTHLPGDVERLLAQLLPEVIGIHVYTSPASPAMEEIADRLHQSGLLRGVAHTVATTRFPCVELGIRHVAARHRADLLSFVTRQRTFAGEQFLQSVTAGLLAHSSIPVLTIAEV